MPALHGVSDIPKEVPVVGERKQAKRVASTSDRRREWEHPEAKGGERATSRGGRGPCQNGHGGSVLDLEEEEALQETGRDCLDTTRSHCLSRAPSAPRAPNTPPRSQMVDGASQMYSLSAILNHLASILSPQKR